MIAANLFDHPGFLLLIVFVALVRWLASKAKSQTRTPQNPPTPPPAPASQPIPRGGDSQAEEERIRRFLEALGQPPGTTPPKAVTRRRPDLLSPLPPLKTKPPPLPQVVSAPPPLPFETARETAFEVHDVARQTSSEPAPSQTRSVPAARFNPRVKLGSPQDLRTAIVLREIFGPPRSLQPLDLSSFV